MNQKNTGPSPFIYRLFGIIITLASLAIMYVGVVSLSTNPAYGIAIFAVGFIFLLSGRKYFRAAKIVKEQQQR